MARDLVYTLIVRVPPTGVAAFQAYEDAVLPLLAEHGGTLERRLRGADATVEVHLVRFRSDADFDAYRADTRRAALAGLLAESGAISELLMLTDV
jgi:hypothetical protein